MQSDFTNGNKTYGNGLLSTDSDFYKLPCKVYTTDEITSLFSKLRAGGTFLLVHVNVRDLRTADRFAQLESLIELPDGRIDVVAVSETWFVNDAEASTYQLGGFRHVSSCRETRLGGGVSLYIESRWDILLEETKSSNSGNVQIAKVVLQSASNFITILAFYSRSKHCADELISMLEGALRSEVKGLVIMAGDANINLFDVAGAMNYCSFMASNGMLQCISGVTRSASASCIDHIWLGRCPRETYPLSGIVQTSALADHYPIFIGIVGMPGSNNRITTSKARLYQPRRIFSSDNYLAFSLALQQIDWTPVLSQRHPNDALDMFTHMLYVAYDYCFPVTQRACRSNTLHARWFNQKLRKARRELDRLSKRATCPEVKAQLKAKRRLYRKEVISRYRQHQLHSLYKFRNSPKSMWEHINNITGRNRDKTAPPCSLTVDGLNVSGKQNIAETFCEHFGTSGLKVVESLGEQDTTMAVANLMSQASHEFQLRPVSFGDIAFNAARMKADLKGSISEIPSKVLQQVVTLLLAPLQHVFNCSISQGVFPNILKKTIILPLYKGKGDPSHPDNYRPIAITSFLSKLLERCIKQQLAEHLESTHFFSPNQHGFRHLRSTESALCSVSDFVAKNCEGGNAVIGLFLDVSKAFDCISHKLLLSLMRHFKFGEKVLSWFESYLTDRNIVVRVQDAKSAERGVSLGVPQGSVLGPYLFILYLNPLLQLIEARCQGVRVITFADDTTILFKISKTHTQECIDTFNSYITTIQALFRRFLLKVNSSKTKILVFRTPQCVLRIQEKSFLMDGSPLPMASVIECLGLRFSTDLKWRNHLINTSKKCYAVMAVLVRLKLLGYRCHTLLMMYKVLFEPVLFYVAMVWGITYNNVINKFQIIQNDALRAIYGLPRHRSVRFVYKQFKILRVRSVVQYKIAVWLFKQKLSKQHFDFMPRERLGEYTGKLRSASQVMVVERHHSTLGRHRPEVAFANVWNSLPAELKASTSITHFKQGLREHLLNIQLAVVEES